MAKVHRIVYVRDSESCKKARKRPKRGPKKEISLFFLPEKRKEWVTAMKAYLILEDGHVFEGTGIGSGREAVSEIVFNTAMTGYLEVLTDPSYAGQAVVMTYPLIGNYGVCFRDMESAVPWLD